MRKGAEIVEKPLASGLNNAPAPEDLAPGRPAGDSLDAETSDRLAAAWHTISLRFHRIQYALDRELQASHDLTVSEFEVLELLSAAPDQSQRMSQLAGDVHLTQSALSRVVSRLDAAGLVERSMCTTDRRSVFATLTDAGVVRYHQARPTHRATLAKQCVECSDILGAFPSEHCDY